MNPTTIKLLGIAAGAGAGVPGAEDGPYSLRQAGLVPLLERHGHTVEDLGDIPGIYETRFATSLEGVQNLPRILQVNRHTHACVLGTRRRSPRAFLLVVGGDHSLAIGTLAGLTDACDRLGLIWIDAHADYNTPASTPSGNLHGMGLAVACGHGLLDLRSIASCDPMVEERDVWLLGPREVDPGELENLAESHVHLVPTDDLRREGAVQVVRRACEALEPVCDHIHLSFDIDVLDPPEPFGTGTPVPDGLPIEEAAAMLEELNRRGTVRSAEFVEFNPHLDASGRTGRVALELIETLLRT